MIAEITPLQWAAFGLVVAGWIAMVAVGIYVFLRVLNRNAGGGFNRLLACYAAGDTPPPGSSVAARRTIQVGWVVWKRCATVGAGPAGLFLKTPLRRAVLIPWQDVHDAVPTTLHGRRAVSLLVGQPPGTTVTVFAEEFAAIRGYLAAKPAAAPGPVPTELVGTGV